MYVLPGRAGVQKRLCSCVLGNLNSEIAQMKSEVF